MHNPACSKNLPTVDFARLALVYFWILRHLIASRRLLHKCSKYYTFQWILHIKRYQVMVFVDFSLYMSAYIRLSLTLLSLILWILQCIYIIPIFISFVVLFLFCSLRLLFRMCISNWIWSTAHMLIPTQTFKKRILKLRFNVGRRFR